MAFILASWLRTNQKDECGVRHPIPLTDINQILTNIKKYTSKTDSLVWIANDPSDYENNDIRGNCVFDSFDLSGFKFKKRTILDNRNKKQAKEIVENADLIILPGGKVICQINFLKEIKLKALLKNFKGLIMGTSAGAMNLCKVVCNFPDEIADLGQPLWTKGLGFYNKIIIPHFDGETKQYQFPCEEMDIANDYILPASMKKELIWLPNDSYILIEDTIKFFGTYYKIKNKKIKRFNVI